MAILRKQNMATPFIRGEYYFGKKVGTWQYFYASGKLSAECKYPGKEDVQLNRHQFDAFAECVYYEEDGTIKSTRKKK